MIEISKDESDLKLRWTIHKMVDTPVDGVTLQVAWIRYEISFSMYDNDVYVELFERGILEDSLRLEKSPELLREIASLFEAAAQKIEQEGGVR